MECLTSMLQSRGLSIPSVGLDEGVQETPSWKELLKRLRGEAVKQLRV